LHMFNSNVDIRDQYESLSLSLPEPSHGLSIS